MSRNNDALSELLLTCGLVSGCLGCIVGCLLVLIGLDDFQSNIGWIIVTVLVCSTIFSVLGVFLANRLLKTRPQIRSMLLMIERTPPNRFIA